MTLAINVIKTNGNLRNSGEAADILLGYELATGLSIGDATEWSDLPLGAGADLINFANSATYSDLPRHSLGRMIAVRAMIGRPASASRTKISVASAPASVSRSAIGP